jgi:hypothetical protein
MSSVKWYDVLAEHDPVRYRRVMNVSNHRDIGIGPMYPAGVGSKQLAWAWVWYLLRVKTRWIYKVRLQRRLSLVMGWVMNPPRSVPIESTWVHDLLSEHHMKLLKSDRQLMDQTMQDMFQFWELLVALRQLQIMRAS